MPNSVSRLSIKSLPPSAPGPAYAVLCTPNKSFQIRQVQTSNSLFVTQPTLDTHGNGTPTPTTCAIASCAATLELHPSDASAAAHLSDLLPVYNIVAGEVDTTHNRRSKANVFDDVPLSDAQCEQAWDELLAFELSGSSYRPSVNALHQVWSSINATATAESVQLDSQFLGQDLANLVAEEGHPAALALAVFRHLANSEQDTRGQWSCLDRRKTVSHVGTTLLQARWSSAEAPVAQFVEEWRDLLPETWRNDAELSAIEGSYDLPSSTTIRAKSSAASTAQSSAPKPAAAKGKWHEKFAKMRKK